MLAATVKVASLASRSRATFHIGIGYIGLATIGERSRSQWRDHVEVGSSFASIASYKESHRSYTASQVQDRINSLYFLTRHKQGSMVRSMIQPVEVIVMSLMLCPELQTSCEMIMTPCTLCIDVVVTTPVSPGQSTGTHEMMFLWDVTALSISV